MDTNDITDELASLKSDEIDFENLNNDQILTPEKATAPSEPALADLNWSMFDIVTTLGQGAFGQVYKVKCL